MKQSDFFIKRVFDISISFLGLVFSSGIILIAWAVASIETRSNGLFIQKRIGLNGKIFSIYKIKTMYHGKNNGTSITTINDQRITKSGSLFRRTKVDELPQLFNVLIGDMSFVGPRPDVTGYADKLNENDKIILSIRPGITGPATLKYKDEETILANQACPEQYNNEVIYPDKVNINKKYIDNYTFQTDLNYIFKTFFK